MQHKKKKERQHHLFVVAHLSVTWNTPRREKVEFPAELSALKLARTRGAPGLLKARPQFYLFPCYFRIRARVLFFFLFVLRKCLLPLRCHTALNSKRETRRRNCSWWLCGENQPTLDWKRRSKFTPNLKQLRKANNLKGAFVSQPPWWLPVAAQHEQKAQVFKSTRPLNNFEAAALLWSDEGITGFTSGPVNTLLFSHELHVTWPRTRTKRTLIPLLGWNNYLNAPLPWAGRSPGRPLVSH